MKSKWQFFLIRLLDILGSLVGLLISAAPILVISIIVKKDGGPIFFKQKRIGKDGNPFMMWKIRSMVVEAEALKETLIERSDVKGMFKMKNDPRVTSVGRFIRKYSLDELPQFWNVLKGEMSLVGPRPALPDEVDNYSPKDKIRLTVIPGITGLWQISGRSDVDFNEMIELDIQYIASRNVWNNIVIICKTLVMLLPGSKNGAY